MNLFPSRQKFPPCLLPLWCHVGFGTYLIKNLSVNPPNNNAQNARLEAGREGLSKCWGKKTLIGQMNLLFL